MIYGIFARILYAPFFPCVVRFNLFSYILHTEEDRIKVFFFFLNCKNFLVSLGNISIGWLNEEKKK